MSTGKGAGGLGAHGITGRVQRTDGRAVAGVALTLIDQRGHQVSRSTGGPDGSFAIEPPTPGSYVLIASAGGHQPTAVNISVDGRPQRLDLTMDGSGELSGTVHTVGRARPVSGATITLTDLRGEVVAAAVSGVDGGYTCQGVGAGTYTLVAVAEHMRPAAFTLSVPDSGFARHDVELAPTALLSGTVFAEGRALADAQVIVRDEAGMVLGTTRTDGEGRYTVTDLAEGNYTVVARGYPPVSDRVTVDGGQVGHDIQLGYDIEHRAAVTQNAEL
jgi:uncharacterized surface anchored protein